MKIHSATFGNTQRTAVALETDTSGSVLVDLLSPTDNSGGWRELYEDWIGAGGITSEHVAPGIPLISLEIHLRSQGYDALSLINLKDIEDRMRQAEILLPDKCAAVRTWISEVQICYAQGLALPTAPYSYQEVLAEILPHLTT